MKLRIKSHWFMLAAGIYFATVLNMSLWRFIITRLDFSSPGVSMEFFFLFVLVCLIFWGAANLITYPYVTKPILAVLLVISSAANFFMFNYGVLIDTDMITNVFETDAREALDLVSATGITWVLVSGILPAILVCLVKIGYAPPLRELGKRLITLSACLLASGLILFFFYKDYSSFWRNNNQARKLINPSNYIYSTVKYFKSKALVNRPFERIDPSAELVPFEDAAHTVLIIVVGETARAKNFSINGYGRPTTPNLAKQDIANFANASSCGTATAVSLPCMFSNMGRKKFDAVDAKYTENLIDILMTAGYQVWWRENDGGCKGICNRVPSEDVVKTGNPKYCKKDYCYDEALLDGLEDYIRGTDKDTVIVLHTMGSHGPTYYKRYPDSFRKFTPTCDSADMQKCTREEVVNSYDNTILYTDHIISSAIDVLKKFPNLESGLLYLSDHGESLGEGGVYLHGLPYLVAPEEQTHVPMLIWMSENMKKFDHVDYACLKGKAQKGEYSHDNLFHSVLGLLEVQSKSYNEELDLFVPCRTKPLPRK